jgi:peptide/nickel transport system permease protein
LRHHIQAHRRPPVLAISLFLLKRLVAFVLTMLAASAVIFTVLDVLPGNAAELKLGVYATPEAIAALHHQLGLDRPAIARYGAWLAGAAHGDLGRSVSYDVPVGALILERVQVTLPLAVMAMVLTTVLALALGIYAASRHNGPGDAGVMALSQLGIAVPNFWFGILLILLFSVKLHWFSAGGFPGWDEGVWAGVKALVLPATALAAVQAAILARITRSAVLDVLREDFVRTARAKGLSPRQTLWRHVLRNAFVPVLTVMGLQFANLIAGTVVIENVFSLPGLGRLVFQAIANRDLLVVRNVVMLLAATVIVINFVVDVLYAVIDPRLKLHAA